MTLNEIIGLVVLWCSNPINTPVLNVNECRTELLKCLIERQYQMQSEKYKCFQDVKIRQ